MKANLYIKRTDIRYNKRTKSSADQATNRAGTSRNYKTN